MSAYLVNPETIATIAKYAFDTKAVQYGICYAIKQKLDGLDKVVDVLAKANQDSVACRYDDKPDPVEDAKYIMACKLIAGKAGYRQTDNAEMAKTLNCLEYQSCERDDWFESDAYKILTVCREQILRGLPGYDQAAGW